MPTDTERRERERRASPSHDLAICPLAAEISDCNRERGVIMTTLQILNATLLRLEPFIQAHERQMQQRVGFQGLLVIVSSMGGGVIGFIAARYFMG